MRGFHDIPHSALPVTHKSMRGFRWFLSERKWEGVVERLERFLLLRQEVAGLEVLKQAFNRIVVRVLPESGEPQAAAVAKVFPMRTLRQHLYRWRRYGPVEVANLLEAGRRGLPVPAVYGLGIQRWWGLVRRIAVLMEDLAPLKSVGQLLRESAGHPERQRAILMATVDLFVQMHHAGCRNLDINGESVYLSESLGGPVRVADFQYAWFDKPDDRALAYQAAHFSVSYAPDVPADLPGQWAAALSEQAGVADRAAWRRLYSEYLTRPLTRQERMRMHWRTLDMGYA